MRDREWVPSDDKAASLLAPKGVPPSILLRADEVIE
jgi:hypothetical protein